MARGNRSTSSRAGALARPADGPVPRSGRELARFFLVFLACLVAGVVLLDVELVRRLLVEPWTRWNAAGAAALANAFGIPTRIEGTLLSMQGANLNILDGCNGAQAVLIYLSAVAAFPAHWSWRLAGVFVGTAVMFGANLLRLLNLIVVAEHFPRQLELFHVYVWQVLIVLVAFGLFLFWASRSAPPGTAAAQ
jgi:exosortase H (IPTLxxWG-CTERM-specific)